MMAAGPMFWCVVRREGCEGEGGVRREGVEGEGEEGRGRREG